MSTGTAGGGGTRDVGGAGGPSAEGLRLEGVARRFGATAALRDVSFRVAPRELAVIVGPSGCGKTTALRVIAGFEPPDAGRVLLDGEDLTGVPPERRRAAMVFQHYALFPNLDAAGNVGYAPRVRGEAPARRGSLVAEMLALVDLAGHGARRPHELSGGQQQRVALARALAAEPRLLLLDEPLSNVDPALRRETRTRLRTLHDARGVTTLWVTHDREEALAVADRVVVMRAGEVVQSGAPRDVCRAPATPFVAEFLLDAVVLAPTAARALLGVGGSETIAVRPDRITLVPAADGALRVVSVSFGPVRTEVIAETAATDGASLRIRAHVDTDAIPDGVRPGAAVRAVLRDGRDGDVMRFAS